MRILITGAAGFIGSSLADALVKHDVYGFDNFLNRAQGKLALRAGDRHHRPRRAARVRERGRARCRHPHCAASYADPLKWHRDTDTNVSGGINAALVAKHHGAHLIYFQTILPPISSYAI